MTLLGKKLISELESALRQTELKPETVETITASLQSRRRRRVLVRVVMVVSALVTAGFVFFIGVMVGRGGFRTPLPPAKIVSPAPSVPLPERTEPESEVARSTPPKPVLPVKGTTVTKVVPEPVSVPASGIEKPASSAAEETVGARITAPRKDRVKARGAGGGVAVYAAELIGISARRESAAIFRKLQNGGYSVTLETESLSGGAERYRVRIGNFRDRGKADAFLKRLRANEGLEARVVKRP